MYISFAFGTLPLAVNLAKRKNSQYDGMCEKTIRARLES